MAAAICCNPLDLDDENIDMELEELWELQRAKGRNRGHSDKSTPKLTGKAGRTLSIARDQRSGRDRERRGAQMRLMSNRRANSNGRMGRKYQGDFEDDYEDDYEGDDIEYEKSRGKGRGKVRGILRQPNQGDKEGKSRRSRRSKSFNRMADEPKTRKSRSKYHSDKGFYHEDRNASFSKYAEKIHIAPSVERRMRSHSLPMRGDRLRGDRFDNLRAASKGRNKKLSTIHVYDSYDEDDDDQRSSRRWNLFNRSNRTRSFDEDYYNGGKKKGLFGFRRKKFTEYRDDISDDEWSSSSESFDEYDDDESEEPGGFFAAFR